MSGPYLPWTEVKRARLLLRAVAELPPLSAEDERIVDELMAKRVSRALANAPLDDEPDDDEDTQVY